MASLFQRRRNRATQTERVRERKHEGFLRYAGFRWAKISGGLCLLIIISYALVDVTPRHNGGSWYVSGAPDPRWNDEELNTLKTLTGNDFEVVRMGPATTQ